MDGSSGGGQYSIHSICRICLEYLQNENSYDLFCIPGLAKKLCVCTSLSVEQLDGFPNSICGSCCTRLNDLADFQRLCVDSVQKFQEMVAANAFSSTTATMSMATDPMTFDMMDASVPPETIEGQTAAADEDEPLSFDPLLNHKLELIENEEDVFKMLEHCNKEEVEQQEEFIREKQEHDVEKAMAGAEQKHFDDEKPFYSSDSSMSEWGGNDFEPAAAVAAAVTAATADDASESEASSSSDDDKPLALRLRLRKVPKSKIEVQQDNTDDEDDDGEGENEEEENIEKPARTKPPVKLQRKRIPAAERHLHRIIECHICRKKFKKNERYQEHMKYHNDKLPHQCTVDTCLKGFTTANGLRLHVEHCHAETIDSYPCPEEGCGRTFPRTRLLNWHLKKVHKIVKELNEPRCYPCTECEKIFRCPMALKKHMYKHDGKELPFPCNICGKRFVINSALKDHLMRHAGIKNYVCPYCGVGKTTRQEWNTHINTHTQEKKFKCDLCAHASHNKQNLRMHVKIVHEKIKDYACQYCGKTFGKSNACKMHEMTHTGEKRCECKVCGKRFLYAKGLTKHLKTHEKRVLRAIEVYRKRQADGDPTIEEQPPLPELSQPENHSKESHAKVAEEILKVCAESVAAVPKDPRRVERVDIAQLAGTAVNPIPSVAVPSWSPQINFMMKEGPHICPDCGQGFNGPGNLKRHHRIVHEGVKDFACRFCHRRFAKAQTLKHHEMTHTGEKPHECPTCGNRFIQYVALKRHMKVHINRPPVIPASVYAAREELEVQERKKLDAKRQAEEKRQAIAEAAKEQLSEMEQQQADLAKMQQDLVSSGGGGGDGSGGDDTAESNAAACIDEDMSSQPTTSLPGFTHINTSTMGIRTVGINDA